MDELLLRRIKNGDKEAFAKLYDGYAEYALRVAASVTGSESAGADAVQEAFIRVYYNIDTYDLRKSFKAWFYKILMNECYRIMKKNSRSTLISDFIENEYEASKEDEHKFEEYEELYRAVNKLDEINRTPIILKYLEGFKESEISDILSINVNTVKSRLLKGRRKLKKILENSQGGQEVNGI